MGMFEAAVTPYVFFTRLIFGAWLIRYQGSYVNDRLLVHATRNPTSTVHLVVSNELELD